MNYVSPEIKREVRAWSMKTQSRQRRNREVRNRVRRIARRFRGIHREDQPRQMLPPRDARYDDAVRKQRWNLANGEWDQDGWDGAKACRPAVADCGRPGGVESRRSKVGEILGCVAGNQRARKRDAEQRQPEERWARGSTHSPARTSPASFFFASRSFQRAISFFASKDANSSGRNSAKLFPLARNAGNFSTKCR